MPARSYKAMEDTFYLQLSSLKGRYIKKLGKVLFMPPREMQQSQPSKEWLQSQNEVHLSLPLGQRMPAGEILRACICRDNEHHPFQKMRDIGRQLCQLCEHHKQWNGGLVYYLHDIVWEACMECTAADKSLEEAREAIARVFQRSCKACTIAIIAGRPELRDFLRLVIPIGIDSNNANAPLQGAFRLLQKLIKVWDKTAEAHGCSAAPQQTRQDARNAQEYVTGATYVPGNNNDFQQYYKPTEFVPAGDVNPRPQPAQEPRRTHRQWTDPHIRPPNSVVKQYTFPQGRPPVPPPPPPPRLYCRDFHGTFAPADPQKTARMPAFDCPEDKHLMRVDTPKLDGAKVQDIAPATACLQTSPKSVLSDSAKIESVDEVVRSLVSPTVGTLSPCDYDERAAHPACRMPSNPELPRYTPFPQGPMLQEQAPTGWNTASEQVTATHPPPSPTWPVSPLGEWTMDAEGPPRVVSPVGEGSFETGEFAKPGNWTARLNV